ncbi:NAD(P)H-dependent oxidoreductase [Microbulbifer litoralis]|uniref:NAD(P)H-dependent oxidoreductase n=1 Tax=Microbulbifer litoralis TaxID=2933965 RepID=UPI0020278651|nr:NAD(P)H-dependent oxidoreductase [Microbulbifer sp. GX H0434]
MNVLIVLAHPEPQSFNGLLAGSAVEVLQSAGHRVQLDDLYREQFDPVEKASNYADRDEERPFAPLTEQRAHQP